ncbi:DEAD/DEAH box helicase [Sphingomonas guangdongensis]|uniref:DEAD/DEAH box helicase n=1 Tax=Sphingomonas guangdongensis TaxID=1141890 RepID=A0A285QD26_9SPHN|nr:DEAD/DEAH box helicase [Sphingomonas guangdongensis]SOB79428.1 DEAD/DEAH box helicase [Sphingomonas guangdongensis]
MEVFAACSEVNDLIEGGNDLAARNMLIRLLGDLDRSRTPYPQVLNQLIRTAGLFPYLQLETASWDQKFVHEAFAVDVGNRTATLHREQSTVLSKLLDGKSIAVSAPTSFGKSFIIDAFIAAKRPDTVVIIVPTIALMDETRRRLYKKFARQYGIITAPDVPLEARNILIFPQERAFGYVHKLKKIDLLVIDEFYKASIVHDKERTPSLIKAILQLSRRSEQRYYLAPNIKKLQDNVFTRDMEFLELLDFNTVFLEKHEVYKEIGGDGQRKSEALLSIISPRREKSLIYARTYTEINRIAELVVARLDKVDRPHTSHFARWLRENYQRDWVLADLVERGVGVHNGRMHRCLSQLQVLLFEHEKGFDSIISTSSIIEGVNTSAQNVVIWKSKLGQTNLKDFTYKNIIGRGGRMFKHFVGHIYLLDSPPKEEDTQLQIEFPDTLLGSLDETQDRESLTERRIERIIEYKRQLSDIIGADNLARIERENLLQDSDADFLLKTASDMKDNPKDWRGFGYLNSANSSDWERMLFKVIALKPFGMGHSSWPRGGGGQGPRGQLDDRYADDAHAGIRRRDRYRSLFQLERTVTFKLSALLSDVNELHKMIVNPSVDIGASIGKVSHAFLPPTVHNLEEYGLPRMISRKLHNARYLNFLQPDLDLRSALDLFRSKGLEAALEVQGLTAFDRYILKFFFHGITPDDTSFTPA